MSPRRSTPLPFAGAIALALALLLALVAPAAAKEGIEASLDAPIGMDTPAGTVVAVGINVTMLGDPSQPVDGSPIYLRLIGRDGASTREAASGTRTPGHYTVAIAIPAGGARGIEIGLHGTSDLTVFVTGESLVFGGITARTAQAVVPEASAGPVAAAPVAVAPVAEAPAPAAGGPATMADAPPGPGFAPVAAVVALVVALAAAAWLMIGRRSSAPVTREREEAGGHG